VRVRDSSPIPSFSAALAPNRQPGPFDPSTGLGGMLPYCHLQLADWCFDSTLFDAGKTGTIWSRARRSIEWHRENQVDQMAR
jgi:hypothetical protein